VAQSIGAMAASAGWLNWINPFYWFLHFYYRAFTLLAAGFSRSNEFGADRLAAELYGKNAFARGLTKVCTDGLLFDATLIETIATTVGNQREVVNVYRSFEELLGAGAYRERRDALFEKLSSEAKSLFDSHPTFAERMLAVQDLPDLPLSQEDRAMDLVGDAEKVEKDMTDLIMSGIRITIEPPAGASAGAGKAEGAEDPGGAPSSEGPPGESLPGDRQTGEGGPPETAAAGTTPPQPGGPP
jgi:hypothetical protein